MTAIWLYRAIREETMSWGEFKALYADGWRRREGGKNG